MCAVAGSERVARIGAGAVLLDCGSAAWGVSADYGGDSDGADSSDFEIAKGIQGADEMTGMMEASRAVRRKGRGLAMPRQADCVAL